MAKSVKTKQRSPEIVITWKGDVPETTYFNRDGYKIEAKVENDGFVITRFGWDEDPAKGESLVVSAKDTLKLKESLRVKNNDTLLRVLGKRFALKEPHNTYFKIKTSLERRGVPYKIVG